MQQQLAEFETQLEEAHRERQEKIKKDYIKKNLK
jgi:hypothetical protein